MTKELRDYIINYYNKQGVDGIDDEVLEELIKEENIVYSEIGHNHRWYDEQFNVIKLGDKYIGYDWYHITGDNSARDMGLDFDMDSVKEVQKKQKTIDYYE